MVFEVASTNLVVELGIIMVIALGWQFTVGEFVGGPLMIVIRDPGGSVPPVPNAEAGRGGA